jgi:hypothetical protein
MNENQSGTGQSGCQGKSVETTASTKGSMVKKSHWIDLRAFDSLSTKAEQ